MRARAKGSAREAKRVARVTFLDRGWRFHALSENGDYSTSTMYCSLPRSRPFAHHAVLAFVG